MNYIREYYEEIQKKHIVVSKLVKKQVEKLIYLLDHPEENYIDHIQIDGSKKREYFVFDERAAFKPIDFIQTFCKHIKGPFVGKLIKLELWQKAVISSLYGFVSEDTGFRKYQKLHLYVGRKNGKTILSACLMIYEMLIGGEAGAECYTSSTKHAQSKIAWNMAKLIIKKNPVLDKRFDITVNGIYTKPYRDSFYLPLSKDSKKLDGVNAHFSHIDELHAIVDTNTIDVIWDSTKSRDQPIEFITSTMGLERQKTFDEIYENDMNVLNGIFTNDRLLVFAYQLDEEKEWQDFKCWQKANPNLGVSLPISRLQQDVQDAKDDISKLKNLLAKSFNVRQTNRHAWLSLEELENKEVYDLEQFKDEIVIGGFDLSRINDMTAWTTLLFDRKNKKVIAETMYWITQKSYDFLLKKHVPVVEWEKQGYLRISGENQIEYKDIVDYVKTMKEIHGWRYRFINYDAWSASYLVDDLSATLGFSKKHVLIPTRQGAQTLSIPIQEVEAHLKQKILVYQNNPITKWCLTNAEVVIDRNGNKLLDKGNEIQKIDGVATILNCYVSLVANKNRFLEEG